MKVKSLGIELSEAYFGYMSDGSIDPINNNTDETTNIYLTCVTNRHEIQHLCRKRFKHTEQGLEIVNNQLFEYFGGYVSKKHNNHKIFSGKTFWEHLMASSIGDDNIWCINDGYDDRVYLMHSWKGTLYHLGRVFKDHPLERACHWRYKRIKV